MVLELDIERCANEKVGPPRRVNCEILYRLEKGTICKGVETFL